MRSDVNRAATRQLKIGTFKFRDTQNNNAWSATLYDVGG